MIGCLSYLIVSNRECLFIFSTVIWKEALQFSFVQLKGIPDSKVHGANMGLTWVLLAPDGPHVGPMNLAISSAWDRNTSAISKLGDLFSFPSSPTLVEEFQFWAPVPKVRSPTNGVWGHGTSVVWCILSWENSTYINCWNLAFFSFFTKFHEWSLFPYIYIFFLSNFTNIL